MYLCAVQTLLHRKILKTLLNESLNNKIYSTFKETFSNTNLDSVSKLSPKVYMYNKEITKFFQDVNIKYGILLNYTVLKISEVPYWVETFQALVRSNVQPVVHPMQVPVWSLVEVQNVLVPPLPVIADLSHQQAEINRLTQVAQQWSAEGPCKYNQAPANYNQDRFSTNAGRGRSIRPCSTPNMSLVPHNRTSQHFDKLEDQRYGYHDRRFQHNCRQEPDQRRYSHVSQASSNHANNDSTSIMLNTIENFTAKISMQPLAEANLNLNFTDFI